MGISRRKPTSDEGRNRALNTAKAKNDSVPVINRFLTTPTQTRMDASQPLLNTGMANRAVALANQSGSTALVEAAKGKAKMFMSHFIQVFNFGVAREVYQQAHRAFYQLDVNSEALPVLRSEQDIILWGDRLKNGDTARVAAGGAAMANPVIADVNTQVANFKTQNTAQSALKDAYDTAQQAVEALRPESDAVIKKIWDEVETFFNEETPSSKRRKAREYGVVYESDIKLTFNFTLKDSVSNNAIENVECLLDETNNTVNTDALGKATMESNISDEATFRFSHADFVSLDVVVDLTSGEIVFEVVVALVHV